MTECEPPKPFRPLLRAYSASVRGIVEFILKSGSISSGVSAKNRMQEGIIVHQRIQKRRKKEAAAAGLDYECEYPLKTDILIKDIQFTVDGRADGILIARDGDDIVSVVVEEIKSTGSPVSEISVDPEHWHFAQAKFYAYMFCAQNGISSAGLALIYSEVETEEERRIELQFTFGELEAFVRGMLESYYKWADMELSHKAERGETAKALNFPYNDYRAGQRKLAHAVYKTIVSGKKLFAQAPTGTGKTISSLFPAVKAIGEGLCDKLFYLTAKTVTRQVASDAAERIMAAGCKILSVTLTAKDKICLGGGRCNPFDCPYANGHFDRVNDALWDILTHEQNIVRQSVTAYAEKHVVCPHELVLDASLFADLVIGDYNHVFDPKAGLKRFFGENVKRAGDYVFLIDESHNLPDRAREMFSAQIYKQDFLFMKRYLSERSKPLAKLAGKINTALLDMKKRYMDGKKELCCAINLDEIYKWIIDFAEKADLWLSQSEEGPDFERGIEIFFRMLDFARVYEHYDESYSTLFEDKNGEFSVRLFCVDPSGQLAEAEKKARSTIFFSATLTPLSYFVDILGGDGEDNIVRMNSPFPRENLGLIINNGISTKYRDRESSYAAVADNLMGMVCAKKGNYFAFFSSYEYMKRVREIFTSLQHNCEIAEQEQNMDDDRREGFLAEFRKERGHSFIAFAVMGGLFSEGIDLPGELLSGAAVVGVGLPLISFEREVISGYYDQKNGRGCGFDYAYVYPGMNKVMQAAGRVIRTEHDLGVVLLIDKRFSTGQYKEMYPWEWGHYIETSAPAPVLEGFWKNAGENHG